MTRVKVFPIMIASHQAQVAEGMSCFRGMLTRLFELSLGIGDVRRKIVADLVGRGTKMEMVVDYNVDRWQ
jgi:hypothetical protein